VRGSLSHNGENVEEALGTYAHGETIERAGGLVLRPGQPRGAAAAVVRGSGEAYAERQRRKGFVTA